MKIDAGNGVLLTEGGAFVHGKRVSWEEVSLILDALPKAVHDKLGWFTITRSACVNAKVEIEVILKVLKDDPSAASF